MNFPSLRSFASLASEMNYLSWVKVHKSVCLKDSYFVNTWFLQQLTFALVTGSLQQRAQVVTHPLWRATAARHSPFSPGQTPMVAISAETAPELCSHRIPPVAVWGGKGVAHPSQTSAFFTWTSSGCCTSLPQGEKSWGPAQVVDLSHFGLAALNTENPCCMMTASHRATMSSEMLLPAHRKNSNSASRSVEKVNCRKDK